MGEKKKFFKRINVAENYEKVQDNIPALVMTVIFSIAVMLLITLGVFFIRVKGAEQVLVPNVVGLQLEDAIMEMQVKQLYPKVRLRYTDNGVEKGVVLEQTPSSKSIVKGYSTVTLTVSRGPVQATVEDYVGMTDKDLKIGEELAHGKNDSAIVFSPIYKYNQAPEGTIIAQFPEKGTQLFSKTNVSVVVSKGPTKKTVEVPSLVGLSVQDFFIQAQNTPLIFDATSHAASEGEVPGTITTQNSTSSLEEYSRVSIDFAFPIASADPDDKELAYGLLQQTLADYPVPVKMELNAISVEGEKTVLYSFTHTGGDISIPYAVEKGTTLVFTVNNKEAVRKVVG